MLMWAKVFSFFQIFLELYKFSSAVSQQKICCSGLPINYEVALFMSDVIFMSWCLVL